MAKGINKEYKYKGYTFYQTSVTTTVRRDMPFRRYRSYETIEFLYEINGLKECGKRPFLTSITACKEYINEHKERN